MKSDKTKKTITDNTVDPALEAALEGLDLHFAPGTILHMGERNIEKQIRTIISQKWTFIDKLFNPGSISFH